MSYSIVQTKEKSRLVVTAVPTNWVVGDHLLWPEVNNKVELDALLRDPNSIPDEEWKSQKCSIRASNIQSYVLALAVEKAFLKCDDTDDEQITLKEIMDKPLPSLGTSALNKKLENLFRTEKPLVQEEHNIVVAEVIATCDEIMYNETPLPVQNSNEQVNPTSIKNILSEVIRTEVKKNVDPLIETICRLETKLDEVLKKFNEPIQCFQEQEDISYWCNYKFPLNTIEEVNRLEKELLGTTFYKQMAEYLLRKTYANDTKDVKKVTKRLLMELFTLDLLNSYSWTGRGNKKPAFSNLNRILNLTLDIEKRVDYTYNEVKSSDFLQHKWFKCLNQTIRRTELNKANKSHIDNQVDGEATIVQGVEDNEDNL